MLTYISHTLANDCVSTAVPAVSPARGGDVAVYVFDINQLNLPTPFLKNILFLYLLLSLQPFQLYLIP